MTVEQTLVFQPPTQALLLRLETDAGVHTFDLAETSRVSLGRHPFNDVRIRSQRVSSFHADIRKEAEGLFVCDKDSTNGTFVNDEAVSRQKLESGDRITVGGFTLTVQLVPREAPPQAPVPVPVPDREPAARFAVGTTGSLLPFRDAASTLVSAGDPEGHDTTLPDLLRELGREGSSVTVAVGSDDARGLVQVIAGGIVDCQFDRATKEKALYRLLALPETTYEILPLPPTETVSQTLRVSTDVLLAEGMQQVDALDKLIGTLPPMTGEIRLDGECPAAVNTLTADEVEIYELLIRHRTIGRVLDESSMTDFVVLMSVHGLLHRGFFRAAASASSGSGPGLEP